jgi:hypothetical protein
MRTLPFFMKKSLFRELFLGIAASVLVFACALAWGGPFLSSVTSGAVRVQQSHTESGTFIGTVVRTGEQFDLHETSGQVYRLDDPQHAQTFEGREVTVTGTLDTEAGLIHVEQIAS